MSYPNFCKFSIIDVILALGAINITIVEVNVEEMLLDLGMFLYVAIVASKVNAVHAGVQARAWLATRKTKT